MSKSLPAAFRMVLGADSVPEAALVHRCERAGLPKPAQQFQVVTGRKYRFDLAWPDYMVAVEVQGGQPSRYRPNEAGGAHNRRQGYERDTEKSAQAQLLGWIVLGCTPAQIATGQAMAWITQALRARGWQP